MELTQTIQTQRLSLSQTSVDVDICKMQVTHKSLSVDQEREKKPICTVVIVVCLNGLHRSEYWSTDMEIQQDPNTDDVLFKNCQVHTCMHQQ